MVMFLKKSSGVILYNAKNQVLLQKRSAKAIFEPLKWGLFGGGIEGNETPYEAAMRECYEELSYNLKTPKMIFEGHVRDDIFMCVFTELLDETQKLILSEGDEMGWYNLDELINLSMIDHDREIIMNHFNPISYA